MSSGAFSERNSSICSFFHIWEKLLHIPEFFCISQMQEHIPPDYMSCPEQLYVLALQLCGEFITCFSILRIDWNIWGNLQGHSRKYHLECYLDAQTMWHCHRLFLLLLGFKYIWQLGAGTSLPGILAAKIGSHVTLTDINDKPEVFFLLILYIYLSFKCPVFWFLVMVHQIYGITLEKLGNTWAFYGRFFEWQILEHIAAQNSTEN